MTTAFVAPAEHLSSELLQRTGAGIAAAYDDPEAITQVLLQVKELAMSQRERQGFPDEARTRLNPATAVETLRALLSDIATGNQRL